MDNNKMGTAPMIKLIISMSLPAIFSMFVQALYNVVDGIFVAKLNSDAFVAVSLALPVQMLITSFAVGTGIGLNSLISRKLGEKNFEQAELAATNGVFIAVVLWFIFAINGFLFSKSFIQLFTESKNIINYGTEYLQIITMFSIGIFVQIAFEKTLQATGNMIYPMIFQIIGALFNTILDPIMIFGLFGFPALQVRGAAISTVVSQIIGVIFSSYIIFTKEHIIKISFKNFRPNKRSIKDIFRVGFPAIVMQSITSVLVVGINKIFGNYSSDAIFVVGTYSKLQNFVFMPVYGLVQGMMPIMGYNYGAKNKKRLTSCFAIGTSFAFCIMTIGMIIFIVFPNTLLDIFDATNSAKEIGVIAFRILAIGFPIAAGGIAASVFFQAIGKGFISLIVSALRQLVITLPTAYLFANYIGINISWLSFPLGEFIALLLSSILMIKTYKKDFKNYFGE